MGCNNLSKDKNSGDYNPFYTGDNNIYPEPLTKEEMEEMGYTMGEYKIDDNGYYAWVYTTEIKKDSCCLNKHKIK